jgi:hypothetical protein
MPTIKTGEMNVLDRVLMMVSGYVLDFSDRTMWDFFDQELGIDIDDARYHEYGGSKGKRLRCFLRISDGHLAARALRALWSHRRNMRRFLDRPDEDEHLEGRYFEIIARLEGGAGALPLAGAVERFSRDETLEELVASIERDIAAKKPQVALDRLHTYCMKKFAHLLRGRGDEPDSKETLNARAGRYFNPIRRAGVRPITGKIMKSTVEIFEQFNSVRNDESLAHDNELVDQAEAQYIFDSVVSLLRFLKATEGAHFGA